MRIAADPPGEGALLRARAEQRGCEMYLQIVASALAAERASADNGHLADGRRGVRQGGGVLGVARRQPCDETLLLGALVVARRHRPAGKGPAGFVIIALPGSPHSQHRRVFPVEDVRPGGNARVAARLALQIADG